jgi:DNA primase
MDAGEEAAVRRNRARKDRLSSLVEAAAGFYRNQFTKNPAASVAHDELKRRGIGEDTAKEFRLGYAPAVWDALAKFLGQRGLSPAEAEQVGLLIPRKQRSGHYDRFRNRLMFPVGDIHGRVVAFSGRALPPPDGEPARDEPKYVNSPESLLYTKGALLFGLHQARVAIRQKGFALLCEGNFDLLALYEAGVTNAVAPLGTAFTQTQANLLHRFTPQVVLLFDGDAAGRKATRAAYPLLAHAGLSARVVALPEGDDPDSFLRSRGADALLRMVETAPGIAEYLIDNAANSVSGRAFEKAAAIQELGPVIAAVESPVERQLYIERVARRFEIKDLEAVKGELRKGARARKSEWQARPASGSKGGESEGHHESEPELPRLESDLLGILLDIPELFSDPLAKKLNDLLTSGELRSIFQTSASMVQDSGAVRATELLTKLEDNPALRWLQERLAVQKYDSFAKAQDELRNGIRLLEKRNIESELRSLAREISEAYRAGDEERALSLTRKRDELTRSANRLMQGLKG